MALVDDAAPAQPDRHVWAGAMLPGGVHHPALVEGGRRHRVLVVPVRMPQPLAGRRVVAVEAGVGVDDQFVALRAGHDQRRAERPKGRAPVGLPAPLTRASVERQQIGAALVIGLQDDQVFVEHRRSRVAPDELTVAAVECADQKNHLVAIAVDPLATEGPLIVG